MRWLAFGGGVLLAAGLAAALLLGGHARHRSLMVGGVEDAAKWADPGGNMALATRAGFQTIVLSSVWQRPLTAPTTTELDALGRAIDAAEPDGIEPIVAVYSFGASTPLTGRDRAEFTSYALAILRAFPELRTISIGNEPNSNDFWRPQFGPDGTDVAAGSYFRLLETAYTAIKQADPHVTVIGGSLAARGGDRAGARRPSHSPTTFIADLGSAFRGSRLAHVPLDLFSLHPYPVNSSVPPTVADPRSTSIGIADYPKLVRLLREAFGTPPPIVYGEYGIETRIPHRDLALYSGSRAPSIKPVSEVRQADDYVAAIRLAACQPLVRMLIFFHVTDESAFAGLQTGLFYPNGRPKESLARVAGEAQAAEAGRLHCGT
ncbi:MAG TPA: hypothetical protein VG265_06500 [Gaiellaceae bacterium]|nr:hypothetical protein [Gaiellaceae bacterium]